MAASLGPTWSLRPPNGASPRCLTVHAVAIAPSSASSRRKHGGNNTTNNNPFDDDDDHHDDDNDDDYNDNDDDLGGSGRCRYVYSVAYGTDRGSFHLRNYPRSSSSPSQSTFDSGVGLRLRAGGGVGIGGRDNRSSMASDPSRLSIDPVESDRLDMRGGVGGHAGGSIANVVRAYRRPERDYEYDYDDAPIFLLLIDDGIGSGEINNNGGGGGGPGAYATRLVAAMNGTIRRLDDINNDQYDASATTKKTTTTTSAAAFVGPSLWSPAVLPRVSCAAYHPDSGYVCASGTGVFGLHHPEVHSTSYSNARSRRGTTSVPIAMYLGCDRALPHPGVRTSSAGGRQDMALCCSGRVAIVAVANAFYGVPCCLCIDIDDAIHASTSRQSSHPSFPSVAATRIASFAQSSQVHPVIAVEIVVAISATTTGDHFTSSSSSSYASSFLDAPLSKYMRPSTSLVFLASGRECTIVDITSTPESNSDGNLASAGRRGGGGLVGGIVPTTVRSSTRLGAATTLPSPILAAASLPPAEGSGGGDLSSGSLLAILTVDGMVHVRSPSCIAVALTSIEVGTRPNDFFTLSTLPLLSSSSSSSSSSLTTTNGGVAMARRRTVIATSYGGESRLIVVEDRESSQDFADRLMRLCIDAFGPNGFPRLELAEALGATFSATSYAGSGGGDRGEPLSSSTAAFAFNHNRRMLLRQYLESVLGLADNLQTRVPSSSATTSAHGMTDSGVGDVLLRVGDGMEVEAVDLEVQQNQESNNSIAISSMGANSLLTCTTLLCLVCYQLSSPDGAAAIRASKACASALGISSSLAFSKAAVAVCELVADRLLKEVTSMSMASFSLLTTPSSVSAPIVSSSSSSSSSSTSMSNNRASHAMATMEFVESAVWLLRSCGCHEKAINVLQERMNSPSFRNSIAGGSSGNVSGYVGSTSSTGGAVGWSQIKFDSYIATHLGELWSSNDDRYRHIVLQSSATRDLIAREPSLGLSVFTMMHPQNEKEWKKMRSEDDPLAHPLYPSKVVELLKSVTPQQIMGTVCGGSISDMHRQLTSNNSFSSFSFDSENASCPLPMNSGRALAVSYLESAIGIATGRPSSPGSSLLDEVDQRKADMHDELSYLLLEGVISERVDDDGGEDSNLGAIYRFKLRRLLSWPHSKIRSERLLSSLPSLFLRERALLLGRLGLHEDALQILYSNEKSLDLALEYCDVRHERQLAQMEEAKAHGDSGMGSRTAPNYECAYIPLVKVALTDPDLDRGTAAAIQVLALRRGVIDKAAALRLLPKNIPMSSLARPFLIPAVIENEAEVRRLTVASALLRYKYITLKQKLIEAQLKSQASLYSSPALQKLNLGEPLYSSKPMKARPVHAASPHYPDVMLIKHFFPRHLVIQAQVMNILDGTITLSNIAFVVAESSDEALVPTMELPVKTLPPGAMGCTWCVLSASPQRLDGAAFLTCELRFTVLEADAVTGIPTKFSEGGSATPGYGRTYVEELHDIEVRHTEFG